MLKKSLFLVLMLCSLTTAFSENLPSFTSVLSPAIVSAGAAFQNNGAVLKVDRGYGAPGRLLPAFPGAQSAFGSFFTHVNERAFRFEAIAMLSGTASYVSTSRAEIFNRLAFILNSVQSLEGISYWSESRKKTRTLFSDYYRIVSLDDRTKQPDPTASDLGTGKTWEFLAYQKDLTFSGLVVRYRIRQEQDCMVMMNENATPLKLALLPVVSAGNMKNGILIIPCAEGLLVYFAASIQAWDAAAGRVFESTENKSLAVLRWFADKAAAQGLIRKIELPMKLNEF